MKKLLGISGMLLLACSMLLGCARTKFYSQEDLNKLHDVIGFVEEEQFELQKVIGDSLTTKVGEKMMTDMDFVDYLTTKDYDPDKPMIALTFDDGPSTSTTNDLLDILEANNAKATFFVVGDNLGENTADILKRMVSLGCEIGNHSVSHEQLTTLDRDGIVNQIEPNNEKILELSGRPCRLIRPPYGSVDENVKATVNQPLILWDIDSLDWKSKDPDKIIPIVREYVADGTIILMHDIHAPTIEACKTLIPELAQKYQLVTVSELAYMKGVKMEAGEKYFDFCDD